jgi:hypothetical protein
LVLAVVMLVGSMGCELVALLLRKIANGERSRTFRSLTDGPAVAGRSIWCELLCQAVRLGL